MPRKVYGDELKQKIVDMHQRGQSQKDISILLQIDKSVISRTIKRYNSRGTVSTASRSGRPRKTTAKQDRLIARSSKNEPFATSSEIKNVLDLNISPRTVQRRLVEASLFSFRPAKKPLISNKQRKARLQFARSHLDWNLAKWRTVLFSDESKFNLIDPDGMARVRRPKGARLDPKYYRKTLKHGGGSLMVWGCFSAQGMGPLYRINGIMNGVLYRDIMQNVMLPYAEEEMTLIWRFQQDNDPKHTSKIATQWFQQHNIRVLPWPSNSPDLNPIENLWEIVNRKVRSGVTYKNTNELFLALTKAWNEIPQDTIDKLIDSMPRRCAAVIKNHGYATKY